MARKYTKPAPRACAGCGKSFRSIGKHHAIGPCKGKGWAEAQAPAPAVAGKAVSGAARQFQMERAKREVRRTGGQLRRKPGPKPGKELTAKDRQHVVLKFKSIMESDHYDGFKFCPYCSTPLDTCYAPDEQKRVAWRYCAVCGRGLSRLRDASKQNMREG